MNDVPIERFRKKEIVIDRENPRVNNARKVDEMRWNQVIALRAILSLP
jgi:hypothetical protein